LDPAGLHAAGGHIVACHVYGEPTDVADGADDGIDMRDQDIVSDPRQGYILPKGGTEQDVGIIGLGERENASLENIE